MFYHEYQDSYSDMRLDRALWPERYDEDALMRIQRSVGPRVWASHYEGSPVAKAGKIFDQEFVFYDQSLIESIGTSPEAQRYQCIVTSWDTAFEPKEQNDYSVGVVLGFTGYFWDVLEVVRGKYAFPELKAISRELFNKWKSWTGVRDAMLLKHRIKHQTDVYLLIEKKASGHSLIQEMRLEFGQAVRSFKPVGSKESRASSITGLIEAARVRLPQHAPWLATFLNELDEFPSGAWDDQVDAFVQVVRYTRRVAGAEMGVG